MHVTTTQQTSAFVKTSVHLGAAFLATEIGTRLQGYPAGTGVVACSLSYFYGRKISQFLKQIPPITGLVEAVLPTSGQSEHRTLIKAIFAVFFGVFPAWASTQLFKVPLSVGDAVMVLGVGGLLANVPAYLLIQVIDCLRQKCISQNGQERQVQPVSSCFPVDPEENKAATIHI